MIRPSHSFNIFFEINVCTITCNQTITGSMMAESVVLCPVGRCLKCSHYIQYIIVKLIIYINKIKNVPQTMNGHVSFNDRPSDDARLYLNGNLHGSM